MLHHAYKQQPAETAISFSRQSVHKLFRNVFVFGASFHPHSMFVLLLTGDEYLFHFQLNVAAAVAKKTE